ncbi:MAG: hypothetical protein KDD44_15460, partial [Bdellovibrionales bacterium]|nr:hypothetical protein [Bdellovibrionales bacterium]
EFDADHYVEHEDVLILVTQDGWYKRIRANNDPKNSRIREGDRLLAVEKASTKDILVLFTSHGNSFGLKVYDVVSTSGFGEPVQKRFKFGDGETVIGCMVMPHNPDDLFAGQSELVLLSAQGYGFRLERGFFGETTKSGKRAARLGKGDTLRCVFPLTTREIFMLSEQGYGLRVKGEELPVLSSAGRGVIVQKMPKDDTVLFGISAGKQLRCMVELDKGKQRELDFSDLALTPRARRGLKVVKRGGPVERLVPDFELES